MKVVKFLGWLSAAAAIVPALATALPFDKKGFLDEGLFRRKAAHDKSELAVARALKRFKGVSPMDIVKTVKLMLKEKRYQGSDEHKPKGIIAYGSSHTDSTYWPVSPDGLYYIPYVINEEDYSELELERMHYTFEYFESISNIRMVPRKEEKHYINIFSAEGCWSYVGRLMSANDLSLEAKYCTAVSTVSHELLHALGLQHEHQRADGAAKLRYFRNNVPIGAFDANIKPDPTIHKDKTPFDYASVMHYPREAFAYPGKLAMEALDPKYDVIIDSEAPELSSCDLNWLNTVYAGEKKPPKCVPHVVPHGFEPTPDCAHSHGEAQCEKLCEEAANWFFNSPDVTGLTICQPKGGGKFPPVLEGVIDEIPHVDTPAEEDTKPPRKVVVTPNKPQVEAESEKPPPEPSHDINEEDCECDCILPDEDIYDPSVEIQCECECYKRK